MSKEINPGFIKTTEDLLLGFATKADRDRFIADMLVTGCGYAVTRYEDGELKHTRLDPQDLMVNNQTAHLPCVGRAFEAAQSR